MRTPDATTREQLLDTFDTNKAMLDDVEVWTDYLQPFGRPFGPNVMSLNHQLQLDDAFHQVFWRVMFAMDAGYFLIADPARTHVTADRMSGPASPRGKAWSVYSTHLYDHQFQRGTLELRDTEPLPGWLTPNTTNDKVTFDLRAVVGWLMGLIGDGRLGGVMARFWAEVADAQTTPALCTLHDSKWCPNCGRCTCDRSAPEFYPGQHGEHYDIDYDTLGKPGCPLHDKAISVHQGSSYPLDAPAVAGAAQ